jgi:hypothetical protein
MFLSHVLSSIFVAEKTFKSVEEEKEELRKRLEELEKEEENTLKDQLNKAFKVTNKVEGCLKK